MGYFIMWAIFYSGIVLTKKHIPNKTLGMMTTAAIDMKQENNNQAGTKPSPRPLYDRIPMPHSNWMSRVYALTHEELRQIMDIVKTAELRFEDKAEFPNQTQVERLGLDIHNLFEFNGPDAQVMIIHRKDQNNFN